MIYEKMMSVYKSRIASVSSAGGFVVIWVTILLLQFICGCVYFITEVFLWEALVLGEIGDILFTLFFLWFYFKGADVRFWDPRVYLTVDIDKVRKLHTEPSIMGLTVEFNILALSWNIVLIPLLMFLTEKFIY